MLEILQRVETDYKPLFQDDDDDEDEEVAQSLEERIAGLDLGRQTFPKYSLSFFRF